GAGVLAHGLHFYAVPGRGPVRPGVAFAGSVPAGKKGGLITLFCFRARSVRPALLFQSSQAGPWTPNCLIGPVYVEDSKAPAERSSCLKYPESSACRCRFSRR